MNIEFKLKEEFLKNEENEYVIGEGDIINEKLISVGKIILTLSDKNIIYSNLDNKKKLIVSINEYGFAPVNTRDIISNIWHILRRNNIECNTWDITSNIEDILFKFLNDKKNKKYYNRK